RRGRFGGVTGNRDYHQADEEIAEAECASGGLKRTGQDFTEPAHEAGSHREHAERRRTAPDRLVLDPLRPADREQLPMSMQRKQQTEAISHEENNRELQAEA